MTPQEKEIARRNADMVAYGAGRIVWTFIKWFLFLIVLASLSPFIIGLLEHMIVSGQ